MAFSNDSSSTSTRNPNAVVSTRTVGSSAGTSDALTSSSKTAPRGSR
ncbi:Uncharacterised protein [Mycobacterium tuberculosis]|nr:Uncharacterised protein [Mycobacterium tuberculosis]COW75224.1 Uncharacterised protein [Mycobacterium tuberculosis]